MKFITILFLVLSSSYVRAQWQPNGGNIYYSGGNVGIGTSSPNYKLTLSTSNNLDGIQLHHSNGDWLSIFSPSMVGAGYNGITQSGDAGIIFGTDGGVNTVTNGFVIAPHRGGDPSGFRIDNNGNVGIGTNTPLSGLNVFKSGDINGGSIRFGFSGTNDGFLSLGFNALTGRDAMKFSYFPHNSTSGQTDLMTLDVNGNVGIGTSSPDAQLAVNGNISLTSFGSLSSNRNPNNNYTNLFLGGGIADQANGSYKVITDGGSNYFAAIKMDYSGGNVGAIKFYSGQSTGGSSYTISNANLENYARMTIVNGNVGIGTTSPDKPLTVNGTVHAKEVLVDTNIQGPDYVFEKDYQLTSLDSIKNYIDQNKHLPEVPSAAAMEKNGVQLGEMNMLLLKKIEELTLYVIELKREVSELKGNQNTKQ